jgi:nucleoside diphosphate kinase
MITDSGLYMQVKKDPYIFTEKKATQQYEMKEGEEYFKDLIGDLISGPAALFIIYGVNAIDRLYKLTGNTNSNLAEKGTIREKFGRKDKILYNAFHRSDSRENVKREILLHFNRDELPVYVLDIIDSY